MPQPSSQSAGPAVVAALAPRRGGPRFAFVHAAWHQDIVQRALDGYRDQMQQLDVGADAIDAFAVAGAFELPLMARTLARTRRYDAIVACALVVDGGIYRHDFVAAAVLQGLMSVQLETDVPVLSVVLTPHQFQPHAEHQDFFADHFRVKGAEAARASVQTVQALLRVATANAPEPEGGDTSGTIQ